MLRFLWSSSATLILYHPFDLSNLFHVLVFSKRCLRLWLPLVTRVLSSMSMLICRKRDASNGVSTCTRLKRPCLSNRLISWWCQTTICLCSLTSRWRFMFMKSFGTQRVLPLICHLYLRIYLSTNSVEQCSPIIKLTRNDKTDAVWLGVWRRPDIVSTRHPVPATTEVRNVKSVSGLTSAVCHCTTVSQIGRIHLQCSRSNVCQPIQNSELRYAFPDSSILFKNIVSLKLDHLVLYIL